MCAKKRASASQEVNIGDIKESAVTIDLNISSNTDSKQNITPAELSRQFDRLAVRLEKQAHLHNDIREALNDLREASIEAKKRSPDVPAIRRYANNAKQLLEAFTSVAGLIPLVEKLGQLAPRIPEIFGY